jgi:hypothetical protein
MTEKEENGVPPPQAAASQGNKVAVQLKKMRDANLKYKDLLKMAKDRITKQEDELKKLRGKTNMRTCWFCFISASQVKFHCDSFDVTTYCVGHVGLNPLCILILYYSRNGTTQQGRKGTRSTKRSYHHVRR